MLEFRIMTADHTSPENYQDYGSRTDRQRKNQQGDLILVPFYNILLLLHLEAGLHLLDGLILLLLDVFLHLIYIIVMYVQGILISADSRIQTYKSVIYCGRYEIVCIFQFLQNLLEIYYSFLVPVALLEPARTEEDSVAPELMQVVGLGKSLPPRQPLSCSTIYRLIYRI